jgi:hypothetical protein
VCCALLLLCRTTGDAHTFKTRFVAFLPLYKTTTTNRLLAVGDSITKGSIPSEDRNTPYLAFTRAALAAAVGECFDVEATVAGLGALVGARGGADC